jgi:hypothetical protein
MVLSECWLRFGGCMAGKRPLISKLADVHQFACRVGKVRDVGFVRSFARSSRSDRCLFSDEL